ncbi:cysteine desulfurase NifS [candidate division KSB1 bacterium]|nr:cysteine desulfurase NifS [candidate division KSB1 bacterium]
MRKVYLDHSATTPVEPQVVDVMIPYLKDKFGNASSIHSFGREAKVALEDAREAIARFINAEAREIYFTSGGTESNNMAIKGAAWLLRDKGNHIISSKAEHHAVLYTCDYLKKQGFDVTYLKPDKYGMIQPEAVADAITDKTILVSIMHANNEVGTINPVAEIGRITRGRGLLFHTDAVQSFGKLDIDIAEIPVDMLSFSGHKIYGPKGIGGLFIRKGVRLEKLLHGGAHEQNRRAGTENMPGIAGLAKAVEISAERKERDYQFVKHLRDSLFEKLQQEIPKIYLNGHPEERLYNNLNLSFEGVEGESLLLSLDLKGIAASSGSACTSGAVDPSHVLTSMNVRPELAQSSIRFTLGRNNTMEDIDYVVEILPQIVARLRAMSPLA